MDLLQIPALISKIITMGDHSLRLQVDCQEMTPEDNAKIFRYYNTFGSFAFVEGEQKIKKELINIPEYSPVEKTDKSPSQRFRNVIYLLWKQKGQQGIFDDYYRQQMELLIDHFKDKLD